MLLSVSLGGENTSSPSKFTPPSASAGAFERLSFAFKVLEEGDGFTSQTSQTVYAMGQEQKILILGYRGNGKNVTEEWQYASGIGKNQFSVSYSDSSVFKSNTITNSSHFSYSKKSYTARYSNEQQSMPISTYLNVKKLVPLNDLPVTIDSNTSRLVKYDTRSDEKYYIIQVDVSPNKISEQYLNSFAANGASGVSFSYMSYTFKINKTTGFLYSIDKEENFKAKYFGLNVNCVAKMKSFYYNMNVSAVAKIDQIYAANF